jgi:hypothetical protein
MTYQLLLHASVFDHFGYIGSSFIPPGSFLLVDRLLETRSSHRD